MNTEDADIVLGAMVTMWPNHELTAQQAHLWRAHLRDVDYADAMAVVGVLERTSRFWPHWSEFLEVWQQSIARRRREAPAITADNGRLCTPERSAEWLAKCRAIVANGHGPLGGGLGRSLPPGDPS
jgi:hypothetical protein